MYVCTQFDNLTSTDKWANGRVHHCNIQKTFSSKIQISVRMIHQKLAQRLGAHQQVCLSTELPLFISLRTNHKMWTRFKISIDVHKPKII